MQLGQGRTEGEGSSASKLTAKAKKAKQEELRKIELQQQILRLTQELTQITEQGQQGQSSDNDRDEGENDDGSDNDPNYTLFVPSGDADELSGDRPPTADKPTEENLSALEQLQQQRLAEQEQRARNPPPANESRHDNAAREQRQEFEELKTKLRNSKDPFAKPLRECMDFFESKAAAMELETGLRAKIMEVRSPASVSSTDSVNYTVEDIMSIAPDDSDIAAWASDTILDVKINVVNARIRQHKAYIANIAELGMFIFRDDENGYYANDGEALNQREGETSLEARTRVLIEHRNAAIDEVNDATNARANPLDPSLYPAGHMPADTTRLLLPYNISNSHWVLVEIEVDAAKTHGHVRLYNSMGGSTSRPRGNAYATVHRELPEILRLIQRRPDLGWDRVQFNGDIPDLKRCPQQDNSTDCGFWSIYFAEQLANAEPLSEGIIKGVRKATQGKVLRWEVMKDIYHHLLNKQLAGKGPLEPIVGLGGDKKGGRGSKRRKGPKSSNSSKGLSRKARNSNATGPDEPNNGDVETLGLGHPGHEASDNDSGDTWEQFDDYRFDLRQMICDLLEEEDSYYSEEMILDEVLSRVQALAAEQEANIEGQESAICDRASAILERPCRSLMRLEVLSPEEVDVEETVTEGGPWYRLDPNPVHSVSTAARRALLSSPKQRPQLLDPITRMFLLTVSIVRASGAQQFEEGFENLRERSTEQVASFHNAFGRQSPMPKAVQTWDDMFDLDPSCPPWTDYVFSGTSRDRLFNRDAAGQNGKSGDRLRKLLADANTWAQTEARCRQPVALLWSGGDGGTSDSERWIEIQEAHPYLDFYVVIVQPSFRCWNLAYFRVDEESNNCWAAFDVDTLADLQRGNLEDIQARVGDLDIADLPEYRFTVASNLIQNLKEDMSLRGTGRDTLHIHPQRQNQLAAQLTGESRKTFALAQKSKECEVCNVSAEEEQALALTWSHGHSTDLAVVCGDHADGTITAGVAASATGTHLSSELLSPFAPPAASKAKILLLCRYCDAEFPDALSLDAHLETHDEGRDDRPFPCSKCNKRFKQNGLLQRHMKVHTDEKPHACTKCKSRFKGVEALKLHMRTVHPVREGEWHGLHQCQECNAEFEWLHELVKHSEKHNVACSICKRRFDGPNGLRNLRAHMQTKHSDDRPWPCSKCEKRFKRKGDLRTHVAAVHDSNLEVMDDARQLENPFPCNHPGCGLSFKLKRLLTAHSRVHSDERPHPCTVANCKSRFKTATELKSHLKAVHQIIDESNRATPKPFVCTHPGCNQSFQWKSRLQSHMLVHSGDRPFACKLCDATWKRKSELTVHMRNAHGQ